jgi:hypothetical protein
LLFEEPPVPNSESDNHRFQFFKKEEKKNQNQTSGFPAGYLIFFFIPNFENHGYMPTSGGVDGWGGEHDQQS